VSEHTANSAALRQAADATASAEIFRNRRSSADLASPNDAAKFMSLGVATHVRGILLLMLSALG
jgi:hypothetical protein